MSEENKKNNSGNRNTGNYNSGNRNTGNYNTGNYNTGNWNTGNWNTGYRNTGDYNTSNSNTGNRNTSNSNTGDYNTGDSNTGDYNTGDSNTGHGNTGNWNTVHKETGFFNTLQNENIRVFNKDCSVKEWDKLDKPYFLYFNLTEWISLSNMTDKEKSKNEDYITNEGYLKKYEYKEAFKKSWDNREEGDEAKLRALPNFDADIFKEISGIDLNKDSEKNIAIKAIRKEMEELAIKLKQLENE